MSSDLPASSRPDLAALRGRVALRFFFIGLAVDATVIISFALNPEWLQYFYASAFPVLSRLIFGIFFAGLLVTYRNFLRLVREESRLRAATDLLAAGVPASELPERLPRSGVRDRIVGLLARPEHAAQGDPAGQDALEAREETHAGWAKYITGVLTMLGLLGTFLGLMVAIESIRGLTALEDKEAFFVGVVGALDGMGTAFSTSLAGIFGAVVLGFEQLVFHFAQLSYLTRLQLLVERHLAPQIEAREDVGGLAVELHRFREDLRAWRVDAGSAGADLHAAAAELGGQVKSIADSVGAVLEAVRNNDDRWRDVQEELATLRRVALQENQSLLTLAGHRMEGFAALGEAGEQGLEGTTGTTTTTGTGTTTTTTTTAGTATTPTGTATTGTTAASLSGPASSTAAAGASPAAPGPTPAGTGAAPGPDTGPLAAELRRSNELLAHIYREMGLVLRSASQRVEMRQTDTLQTLARLIQRMDNQAASGAEQIQLLRSLLRYLNADERKLAGVMGVLQQEARRERADAGAGADEPSEET